MRILHVLNDVTDLGNGIVNTAVDLAIEQARQGHTVAIASAGGGYQPLLERHGVLHIQLDQSRSLANIVRAVVTFHRELRTFCPDIVHAHMRTGLLLAWVLSLVDRYPLVAHLHNVHDRESLLMALADRVITVSRSVGETMAAKGIRRSKIRVALNRTLGSPRVPALAEIAPAAIQRPAIVTVCGMNHRKGIAELIAAFDMVAPAFPNAHLYLVGNGPQRQLFEQQAEALPIRNRIHFEGFQSIPQSYMLSADIFVLASRRESLGLALIEARAAGCAIIASQIDGIAEALDGGGAGMLVPPRDVPALANALAQLLGSESERQRWKRRALHGIESFRVERMASEVEDVYRELLPRRAWSTRTDIVTD